MRLLFQWLALLRGGGEHKEDWLPDDPLIAGD